MIESALGASDAAKIEAQHRKSALREGVIHIIHNLIVHRAAKLRVRMQNDGDRRAALFGGMETAFESSGRTVENHFRHFASSLLARRAVARSARGWSFCALLTSRRQSRISC